jgi:hypothetical protein
VSEERDETIERIAAVLRPLPDVDDGAKARLLVAVAAEREREREAAVRGIGRRRALRLWGGAGLAAAAAALGLFWIGDSRTAPGVVQQVATSAPAPAPAVGPQLAADSRDAGTALQPVQLVFRAPEAHRVSVVGDFNGWEEGRAPLSRDPASGLWSVTVTLRPGRHVYAFIVDDSIWMRDPRTPAASDADFGRPGSVMLVGRP